MIEYVSYFYIIMATLLLSSYSSIIASNNSTDKFFPRSIMCVWSVLSVIAFFIIFGITSAIGKGIPPTPVTGIILLVCLLTSCISSCIVYLAQL